MTNLCYLSRQGLKSYRRLPQKGDVVERLSTFIIFCCPRYTLWIFDWRMSMMFKAGFCQQNVKEKLRFDKTMQIIPCTC